jgi:hypothetical protein
VTLSACDSILDEAPTNAFDDQTALVDIQDFERQLLNTYVRLRNEAYYGGERLLLPDAMGDNLILCSDGRGSYQELWRWQLNANTTSSLWAIAYTGIKDANHVIQRLTPDNKFIGTADSTRGDNVLAGAYAMRAFFHFDLVRTYAKTYAAASDEDLGVPYKFNTDVTLPARNTVHEVYEYILDDLQQAEALMTDDYNESDNSLLRKKSLYGLLARIYITMAGNGGNTAYLQKARDYALLAVKGDGTDVVARTAFAAIWTGTNTIDEVMWRVAIINSDAELPGNFYGQSSGTDYRNEYVATQDWFAYYSAADIRATSWANGDLFQGRQYIGIKKYRTRTGSSANKVDAVVMRTSEIYLTLAEAQYHMGQEGLALAALDYVRAKRYNGFSSPAETGAALLAAIKLERRLELAFEGHRWFDLKRWGEGLTRDNKGDRYDGSGTPSPFTTKPGNDPYWALPIPYSEILANPNVVQNEY